MDRDPRRITAGHARSYGQDCDRKNQGMPHSFGGGRRASTLHARVRAVRRYLEWLSLTHQATFPLKLDHLMDYLQARHVEDWNRGAVGGAHRAFTFLEEIKGVRVRQKKWTMQPLCDLFREGLLASAVPG